MPRIYKAASFRSTVIELEEVKCRSPQKEWQALRTNFRFSIPNLAKRSVEELDGFVDVGLGRVQHGGEAKGVAVQAAFANEQAVLASALHHLRGSFGSGLFRLAVFHQFERLHQSHASHVADERMLRLQLLQLAAAVCAAHGRVLEQIVFFAQFDSCSGPYSRDRLS